MTDLDANTQAAAAAATAAALRATWHAEAFPAHHTTIDGQCQYCDDTAEAAVAALVALGWQPVKKWTRCQCNHRGRFCWYQCDNRADGTHRWPSGQAICESCARRCDRHNQPVNTDPPPSTVPTRRDLEVLNG